MNQINSVDLLKISVFKDELINVIKFANMSNIDIIKNYFQSRIKEIEKQVA